MGLALLMVLMLGTIGTAANREAFAPHLPEAPEALEAGSVSHVIPLMFIGSTVSLLVLVFGSGPAARLRDRLARFVGFTKAWRWSRWAGKWHAAGRAQLVIPDIPFDPWELFFREEGFTLVAATVNARVGTAAGDLICSAGGHRLGAWSIQPLAGRRNHFELRLALEGEPDVLLELTRPH
jgi:hypothetical protein